MVKVENNKVSLTRLPKAGRLQDGRTVSNYHLLGPAVLKAEGWLPLTKREPEFNPETHYLRFREHVIGPDSVTAVYEAVEMQTIPE